MSTGSLPPHAYAILGMLRLGARSGYDIRRSLELSARYFWNISPAQIYPGLARLEAEGMVTGTADPRGARQRRTYVITPAGEDAFLAWLSDTAAVPFDMRDTLMLKLFFADALAPADALALVASVRRRSTDALAQLRREVEPPAQALADAGAPFPYLTLRFGLAVHESVVATCDEITAELERGRS